MVERRAFLQAALAALASAVSTAGFAQKGSGKDVAGSAETPFSRDTVVQEAAERSKKPFDPPDSVLREPFASMKFEDYLGIRLERGAGIWSGERRGFELEPLLRGPVFSTRVELSLVEDGHEKKPSVSSERFQFLLRDNSIPKTDVGFSGFRVLRARDEGDPAEVALFQGASFFHARAPDQTSGVSARGLSIRTADPRGEEFPLFRKFWVERPALGDNALVIHSLLDSPSVVGAYRFTLRASEATIIDTELALFPRADLDHIGLASLSGASLFTPLDHRRVDDIRPAVADMGGLQVLTESGEWLWRPISNRAELQVSAFMDNSPKGFGFLQRQRDIAAFQDDLQHFERRPSLWIEPLDDWGKGTVQLIEIPSESEINQNIIAYWRPETVLRPKEGGYRFAYRQFWCWEPPARPPLAHVSESRVGHGPAPKSRLFLVAFSGDVLGDPERAKAIEPKPIATPGVVRVLHKFPNPQRKTHRVLLELDPGGETHSELRLALYAGDEQISETWLYRWTS
ncbi:MAG TPA: glucan biosynthesis protein [Methylocystis sp.]|nr:glucan biosynthesis protein [Methylocystis sp.]